MKTNYLLSVSFLLAIIMAIIITDSCRKSDAKSSTASTILSSITTIDVNSDFKGTNFVNLFTNNKNMLIVSGKDTLCYALGLTQNEKFISYDDQTGEQTTTFISTKDNENAMVITTTSNAAYISGSYKGRKVDVALFNKEQSTSSAVNAYASLQATNGALAKYYTVKNSKMAISLIYNTNALNQENHFSCGGTIPIPSTKSTISTISTSNTKAGRYTISQTEDIYQYMSLRNNAYHPAKNEGEQGSVGDIYYRRGSKGYLEFYKLRVARYATTALPTDRRTSIGWEYIGPFEPKDLIASVGAVYVYDDPLKPFLEKRQFFKLKKEFLYSFPAFPPSKTSNQWWEYLGDDCASKITVKIFNQSLNTSWLSVTMYFVWNSFVVAMDPVTNAFTYVRTNQGSINHIEGPNLTETLYSFSNYLKNNLNHDYEKPFTIYAFVTDKIDPDGRTVGVASFQNGYQGGYTGAGTCFVANILMKTKTFAHEIGHLLNAIHVNNTKDIMHPNSLDGVSHQDANNISMIKKNLKITN